METNRFKFRAWYDGNMYTNHSVSIEIDGTIQFLYPDGEWRENKDLVLMQCTGLNDINGTLVFEGDKFEGEDQKEYFVVVWNPQESRFQLDYYGFDQYTGEGGQEVDATEISKVDENVMDISSVLEMNITGNIYER